MVDKPPEPPKPEYVLIYRLLRQTGSSKDELKIEAEGDGNGANIIWFTVRHHDEVASIAIPAAEVELLMIELKNNF